MTYDFGVVEQRDSASPTALEQRGSALYGRHGRATAIDWVVDGEQLDTRQEWSQRWLRNVVSREAASGRLPDAEEKWQPTTTLELTRQ